MKGFEARVDQNGMRKIYENQRLVELSEDSGSSLVVTPAKRIERQLHGCR